MVVGIGNAQGFLTEEQVRQLMVQALDDIPLDGRRVIVVVPDGTRTAPIPLMVRLLRELLVKRVKALDYLVALGTHQPMSDAALSRLVGQPVTDGVFGDSHIFNHHWDRPESFATLGVIPAERIAELTNGLFSLDVPVRVNKLVLEYDYIFVCGPTFPHEVIGFSGGNKYFFPGISGPEVINFTHWLGAVITSYEVIGTLYTPVRAVVDQAAAMITRPKLCFSMVVQTGDAYDSGLAGLFIGTPEEAFIQAAELSSRVHIRWIERPYQRVLSVMPTMYDDLWTAAKGMYKMEPAVADGGEVIIYAPHIDEISYTHGHIIDEIGYHVRDYFLKQWDRFKHYPWGVLAHSTHLRGIGTYENGVEQARIAVTLATRIPPERCKRVNLGYMNPDAIHIDEWHGREEEGIVVIPKAGELLYRVRPSQASG
ncbi:MAG: lactate racemase domain-containing protein [Anaerolineae bacterium]